MWVSLPFWWFDKTANCTKNARKKSLHIHACECQIRAVVGSNLVQHIFFSTKSHFIAEQIYVLGIILAQWDVNPAHGLHKVYDLYFLQFKHVTIWVEQVHGLGELYRSCEILIQIGVQVIPKSNKIVFRSVLFTTSAFRNTRCALFFQAFLRTER